MPNVDGRRWGTVVAAAGAVMVVAAVATLSVADRGMLGQAADVGRSDIAGNTGSWARQAQIASAADEFKPAPTPTFEESGLVTEPAGERVGWRHADVRHRIGDEVAWYTVSYPDDWWLDSAGDSTVVQSIEFEPWVSEAFARVSFYLSTGAPRPPITFGDQARAVALGARRATMEDGQKPEGTHLLHGLLSVGDVFWSIIAGTTAVGELDGEREAKLVDDMTDVVESLRVVDTYVVPQAWTPEHVDGPVGSGVARFYVSHPEGWVVSAGSGSLVITSAAGAPYDKGEARIEITPSGNHDRSLWEGGTPEEETMFGMPARFVGSESNYGGTRVDRYALQGPGTWLVEVTVPSLEEGSPSYWRYEQTVWAVLVWSYAALESPSGYP